MNRPWLKLDSNNKMPFVEIPCPTLMSSGRAVDFLPDSVLWEPKPCHLAAKGLALSHLTLRLLGLSLTCQLAQTSLSIMPFAAPWLLLHPCSRVCIAWYIISHDSKNFYFRCTQLQLQDPAENLSSISSPVDSA